MTTHMAKQGTDEWLENRLGKMTASNAQTIQAKGAGLTTYIYQKVAEIISGKMEESYINPDMERGNELEDTARASYEMETGNKVEQVGFCEMDKYVGASPDGLVGKDGLVEIKCPRDYNYVRVLHTKKVDPKYDWQIQMQLLVTGRKWCDYVVFHENFNDLIIIRVKRDEDKIAKIEAGLKTGKELITKILKEI